MRKLSSILNTDFKTNSKKIVSIFLLFVLFSFALYSPSPSLDFKTYKEQFKLSNDLLYSKNGVLISNSRLDFEKHNIIWTQFTEISPNFIAKLIQQEDRRFYSHFGFDPLALTSSLFNYISGRSELRGASTIPMQLAKHIYKINSRTVIGKLEQIYRSIQIDRSWKKNEILEAYLNTVYFFGEKQGIGTASLYLFNKSPEFISESEQVQLLKLIKNPNLLLGKLKPQNQASQFESIAPHYHRFLLKQKNYDNKSSIDEFLQKTALNSIKRHLETLKDKNVRDAAVLVLDNKTDEVLVYVANSGTEFSATPFVDMIQAYRQAGSTLKPFLYATAFENSILQLSSWIEDSPVDIIFENGTYSPKNHDQKFHGWVHPATALGSSLNVPAVKTIQLVGIENFWNTLKSLNFKMDFEPDHYGPSLALGTLDVSLWQLVHAYSRFVNENDSTFSELTRNKINWSLSQSQARSLTFGFDSILSSAQGLAVKTGTSKDMKDNWCLAYNKDFTIGVWVGNADNSSMKNVLGVTGAAPIMKDMADTLFNSAYYSKTALVSAEVEQDFLAQERQAEDPVQFQKSNIISPASNSIYAIDPAIPLKFQKIILEADGPQKNLVWKYKGKALADRKLTPEKGRQKIELYRDNKKIDESEFLVK